MTREGALLVILAVVVVLIALGVLAWRRRTRRDGDLRAPVGEIPTGARATSAASGFYVATTPHDEPLERLAIAGLAFRSRADVTVTDHGIALELPGAAPLFIPVAQIAGVDLARVAIDRVVEPGGLVRLTWRAQHGEHDSRLVDTYLRPQDASARALADAIAATLPLAAASDPHTSPTDTSTGTDA
ncbi:MULTISPECIES: PH-like domain-containing protein [unclassified Microbacterium]|uniref:PH-like domain-containing protein n=1 Tax=unclassified Microbacterium TaxID=2609290 RepID=UPI003019D984